MIHYWVDVLHKALSDFLEFMDVGQILYWALFVVVSVAWLFKKHRKSGWAKIKESVFGSILEELLIGLAVASLIFMYFLFAAPYGLQLEAEGRTNSSGQSLQALTSENSQLKGQLADKDARLQTCSGQLTDAQKNVNDCLTQLGKANTAEPPKVTPFVVPTITDTKVAAHTKTIVVLTNKIITPIRSIISCQGDFVVVGATVANASSIMGGGAGWVGTRQYRIGIGSPAWTPTDPLILTVYYNEDDVGQCSISP